MSVCEFVVYVWCRTCIKLFGKYKSHGDTCWQMHYCMQLKCDWEEWPRAPPPSHTPTIIYVENNHMGKLLAKGETVNVGLGFGIIQNKITIINHSYHCLLTKSQLLPIKYTADAIYQIFGLDLKSKFIFFINLYNIKKLLM